MISHDLMLLVTGSPSSLCIAAFNRNSFYYSYTHYYYSLSLYHLIDTERYGKSYAPHFCRNLPERVEYYFDLRAKLNTNRHGGYLNMSLSAAQLKDKGNDLFRSGSFARYVLSAIE